MNYQRKTLPDIDIGQPGFLPDELVGLADESLADLSAALDPCPDQFVGEGFFPVADPPPAPVLVVSPYEFLNLFTEAEQAAILGAAQTNMQIAVWNNMLNHVDFVHLDDPKTIAGVSALETAGLIATGRAPQILANEAPT